MREPLLSHSAAGRGSCSLPFTRGAEGAGQPFPEDQLESWRSKRTTRRRQSTARWTGSHQCKAWGGGDQAREPLAESLPWRSRGRAQPAPGEPSAPRAGALKGCAENKHEPEMPALTWRPPLGGPGPGRGQGWGRGGGEGPELPFLPLPWTAHKQVLEAKENPLWRQTPPSWASTTWTNTSQMLKAWKTISDSEARGLHTAVRRAENRPAH